MTDKALAYLDTPIGAYALIPPVSKEGMPPKKFLVRMSEKTVEEKRKAGEEIKKADAKCVETTTGARFCLFRFNHKEIEGIEMCRPIYELKEIIKEGKPTIEECREIEKNDFLVIKDT